ncbi:MAG: hypothetical protein R3E32_25850 [Chitinophagales bacterium]
MKKYLRLFTSISIGLFLYSCSPIIYNDLDANYKKAIIDAMYADEHEISNNLIVISPNNTYLQWQGEGENKRVLVTSWIKEDINYYSIGEMVELKSDEIWVTACPELQDWYAKNEKKVKDIDLRLEQLLGLPPKSGQTHFIEFWVKPSDMFRPTPDNEITDQTTNLQLAENIDSTYKAWYQGNILYSYYPLAYPWTRLGYTYDWGNKKSEVGLSEFVIRKNAEVIVNSVQTTAEYLKN